MASDNEYWLVAVPGGKSPEREWNAISEKLKPISSCFKFSIPDLKVANVLLSSLFTLLSLSLSLSFLFCYSFLQIGTLNSLVDLSDTLNRLDTFVEG